MKVYLIRHKTNGLFSSGGGSPSWKKRGKVWSGRGHVSSHIGNNVKFYQESPAEVVTCELNVVEAEDIDDAVASVLKRRREREEASRIRTLEYRKKRLAAEKIRVDEELSRLG